jgi:hypothetical protein
MVKIAIILSLTLGLFGEILSLKENGKVVEMEIKYDGINYLGKKQNDEISYKENSNILILFKKISPELIDSFEQKYNLKFKQIMIMGYYVYEIDRGINNLVGAISYEPNVLVVKPDWITKSSKF